MLHHEAERGDVVGRRERVGIAEVDLVLAVGDLVMRRLHLEPHLLERRHDRASRLLATVHRRQVEVSAHVMRRRRCRAVGGRLEQEELRLHAGVHHVPLFRRACDLSLEHAARIAEERFAFRRRHVADHTRHARRRIAPREDPERAEVGHQQHVRLFHPYEPLDRRAVKEDVARQRLLELRRRDLDVLVDAEDVGELEAQKAHLVRVRDLEDLLRARAAQVGRDRSGCCHRDRNIGGPMPLAPLHHGICITGSCHRIDRSPLGWDP